MVAKTKQSRELTDEDCGRILESYALDPVGFMTEILDVDPAHIWPKMEEVAESVRDNTHTAIRAGHSLSKTYGIARLALWFLYCHPPATVITTAPSETQVKEQLWREIHSAVANAKFPLAGNLTSKMLDLQEDTGLRWFMLGFATKPDTVTTEATKFQGYHNDNLMLIFDEAAGILPEIWRAAQHLLTSGYYRFVVIGNPTSSTGDFAECFADPSYNKVVISVKDSPNYQAGKEIVPGVAGREYEQRIRLRYGVDHDQYKIRILGELPAGGVEGAFYSKAFSHLHSSGRITDIQCNPTLPVYTVWDPGYTSAMWFFQQRDLDIVFLRYYEDSGLGIEDYAEILRSYKQKYGYKYGGHYAPIDVDSNAYRAVQGQSLLDLGRENGINFTVLEPEHRVMDGIERTRRFLQRCWFDREGCKIGLKKLKGYHAKKNLKMSTEEEPVYDERPERDGNEHCADAMRYASKAAKLIGSAEGYDREQLARLAQKYRRPA